MEENQVNNKSHAKWYFSDKFLYIVCILLIIGYFAFQTYHKNTIGQNFQMLKKLTQDIATSVNTYDLTHGTYPNKISELNIDLNNAYEGPNFLIGETDDAWCLISKTHKNVSCTKKVLGGRIGFLVNVKDLSTTCIPFNRSKYNSINRLCEKEFEDYNPLFDCESYSYALSKVVMIDNVPAPNCKELLKQSKI